MQNLIVDSALKSGKLSYYMDKPTSPASQQVKAATADALRLADSISQLKKKEAETKKPTR
jgi:hypothetical protein